MVLEVDRVPRRSPPAPPEDVRDWVEGALDDPETEPKLRDELLVEGHWATEPQQQSGTTTRESEPPKTVRLGDEPDVQARLDEWLTAWRRWAAKEREDRPARQLYEQLFSISLRLTEHPEEFELVLGVGCLAWRPADHDPVLRHLLTAPIRIDFDEDTGRLSLGRAEAPESLRVELDMLDPALLGDPQRIQDVRADAGDVESHPLNRDELGPLMRRIVHTLDPNAVYGDEDGPPAYEDDPRACFAPAVILRKRSQQGLVDIFDRILEQLRTTGEVPEGIRPLVDPDHTPDPGLEWDESEGGVISVDEEPFLPLPVNDAQLRVIRRVDHSAQTLVQGPPGTGKTHTAGALISHLLAQGKRVLVTAHTDRALREVRDKLPETIKPLSVALVGASREDMADLKVAVESIGQRAADEDPEFGASRAAATVQGHLDDIDDLRRHRAGVHRDLVDAREHEVRQHQHGPYHGTLASIAQQHQDDRSAHGWIENLVAPASEDPPPLSDDQIAEWRTYLLDAQLRADECDANQDLITPDSLPPPDAFARLVGAEQAAARVSADHETLRQHAGFEAVAALDQEVRTALQERLHELAREADALAGRHEQWLNAALADICAGKIEIWKARAQQIEDLTASATTLIDRLGPLTDVRTTVEDPAPLLPLARTLLDHLQSGGKLRTQADGTPKIAFLTKKVVKESESLFTRVTVNGVPPTTAEQLEAFLSWAEATRYLDALDKAWPASVTIPAEDTLAERLQWHITELGPLKRVLRLGEQLGAEEQRMRQVGIPTPDWNDLSDVHTFAALVDAAAAVDSHADAREPLEELESFLVDAACWEDAAPVIHALRDAAQHRDSEGYKSAHQQMVRLLGSREALARRDELGLTLAHQAPRLHQAVLNDPENAAWTERFRDFERAWKWAAAKTWITGEQQLDVNALQADLAVTENRIRRHVEDLAATRAWAHAVSPDRLTGTARANLQHYAYLVNKLGKGTGKYAPQRRRETRQAMDRCRESVPVWIMPIYRIAEQLNVSQDMFDVVVVDEASQTGLEATFLQYVAPKIVVIGDDKQVSPTATGIELQQLRDLARQYLADDPYRASWQDPQRSLFDEARMRYGGLITLVEHRRCVPEIIGFSNRIAYEREGIRLVPVRQYGADRLEPIKPTFLPDGYTKGDRQRVNPVEVEAVVEQVEKCIADPAYDGKTFGVISLLGSTQADRIEKELLERVPPEEWTARDLRCGTAADFQGSERDVTFLSMVEAPEPGRRLGVLNQEMHLQRFNVAASRAKDQMWVFHSLSLGDIANRECMRFQLLDYCYGVVNRSEATDEITWTTHP